MVRRRLVQRVSLELPQRQRVGRPPRDSSLRIQALEVADQQRAKIDARSHTGPTVGALLVELRAQPLHLRVELMLVQDLVQPVVERIRRRLDHILGRDPQILLPLPFSGSHCHVI